MATYHLACDNDAAPRLSDSLFTRTPCNRLGLLRRVREKNSRATNPRAKRADEVAYYPLSRKGFTRDISLSHFSSSRNIPAVEKMQPEGQRYFVSGTGHPLFDMIPEDQRATYFDDDPRLQYPMLGVIRPPTGILLIQPGRGPTARATSGHTTAGTTTSAPPRMPGLGEGLPAISDGSFIVAPRHPDGTPVYPREAYSRHVGEGDGPSFVASLLQLDPFPSCSPSLGRGGNPPVTSTSTTTTPTTTTATAAPPPQSSLPAASATTMGVRSAPPITMFRPPRAAGQPPATAALLKDS